MCTAISYLTRCHYFGRNLDLEYGYQETVTITPRSFPFRFRLLTSLEKHYALIGMATVMEDYPLYYEATNEKGLSMAGLNFPGNAVYLPPRQDHSNVAPFEFIPWLLGQCGTVREAKSLLQKCNLVNIPFSDSLPLTPLHWLIADRECSIVAEPMANGLHISDNPLGVLTNNPPFAFHLQNLSQYLNVTAEPAASRFSSRYAMPVWSNGMGGLGLPGDYSSASRFVKATFVKLNSMSGDEEYENVSQFFHILDAVAMPRGSVLVKDGQAEITRYSSCCNSDTRIYYYKTYDNSRIHGIDLNRVDLDHSLLTKYPLITAEPIKIQN